MVPDRRHHGKGQHHQRYVTVPSVPGPGFIMVKPEFVLGGFETVFDRPATPFDCDQGFDRSSYLAPGCEEGQFTVRDVAADQQAAGPFAMIRITMMQPPMGAPEQPAPYKGPADQTDVFTVGANGGLTICSVICGGCEWNAPSPIGPAGLAPRGCNLAATQQFGFNAQTDMFLAGQWSAAGVLEAGFRRLEWPGRHRPSRFCAAWRLWRRQPFPMAPKRVTFMELQWHR